MKFKINLFIFLLGILIFSGCSRDFDKAGYVTATMDALYKGDYSAYAEFTGLSTGEVSLYRDEWLAKATDSFMTMTGMEAASEETIQRTTALLKKIYGNARYEAAADETTGAIILTVQPIDIIMKNYEAIQNYVTDFNAQNDKYAFAALSETDYFDTYLNGILKILESNLAQLDFLESVQIEITIQQDENGLCTLSAETLNQIQNLIIQWPQ